MIYQGASLKGIRENNEDCIYLPRRGEISLVLLADGMGGHNAGEIASRLAVQTAAKAIRKGSFQSPEERILRGVEEANRAVYTHAQQTEDCQGMGTTLVLALLFHSHFLCANVGDSRLYHYRKNGELRRISRDHSYVAELVEAGIITEEQARLHPKRNIITRALGTAEKEKADLFDVDWEEGDMVLLCSDGLYEVLPDGELEGILKIHSGDLSVACRALTDKALENGSRDNISVVLVKNSEELL